VLFLTDNPTLGGTIRILQSWLLLAKREHVVDGSVVIPPGSEFRHWLAEHQIPYTCNPLPVPNKRSPWRALWHAVPMLLWMRRRRIELIHCNEHNIYPFGVLLRQLTGLPLVCHIRYKFTREYAEWAFGGPGRQPDAMLWTSRQQQSDCADAIRGLVPGERQHLVPLGLDLDVFGVRIDERAAVRRRWGVADDEIVIGQACALRARKRLEEFVDLVDVLVREDRRIVGVLAGDAMPGDEPYREKLLKHIEQKKLGRHFRWIGNLDDVEPFDQAIDLFVSTSEYETFGNSVCEAMACGRPVVGYRGGSVYEVVGDAGLIVDDLDLPALIQAARECARRPELRRQLGERARQRVRDRFSPAATLRQLVQIYDGALKA
jgi:glycosyltransferase involved in cell wall biosynthesis